jgi:hypothetical protein
MNEPVSDPQIFYVIELAAGLREAAKSGAESSAHPQAGDDFDVWANVKPAMVPGLKAGIEFEQASEKRRSPRFETSRDKGRISLKEPGNWEVRAVAWLEHAPRSKITSTSVAITIDPPRASPTPWPPSPTSGADSVPGSQPTEPVPPSPPSSPLSTPDRGDARGRGVQLLDAWHAVEYAPALRGSSNVSVRRPASVTSPPRGPASSSKGRVDGRDGPSALDRARGALEAERSHCTRVRCKGWVERWNAKLLA